MAGDPVGHPSHDLYGSGHLLSAYYSCQCHGTCATTVREGGGVGGRVRDGVREDVGKMGGGKGRGGGRG